MRFKDRVRRLLLRLRSNVNSGPYWDRVYRQEWEQREVQSPDYVRDYGPIHELIIDLIPDGARVLDLGCGSGVLCRKLKHQRPATRVLGVDFSGYAIAQNREIEAELGIDYLCVDIRTDLSTVPGTFDAITFCEVIEHLEDAESVVADAMALLQEGGLFILTCPHDNQVPDREHVREWGHDEVFHLLCRYGDTVTFKNPPGSFARWMLAYTAKSPRDAPSESLIPQIH